MPREITQPLTSLDLIFPFSDIWGMVWLKKKERKSVNLSSRLYYARLIVASSDMNVTLTRACSFKNVKSLYKCKGGLSALYLSLLL